MELIEQGNHRGQAVEAAIGEASTGKIQVAVRFKFLDLGYDGDGNYVGDVTRVWYGYFNTEENAERSIKALRTAGWRGTDLDDLSDLCMESGAEPPEVQLVVKHEPDQNSVMRDRIAFVNQAGAGAMLKKRLDGDRLKAFAAQMRGLVIAHDQKEAGSGAGVSGSASNSAGATGGPGNGKAAAAKAGGKKAGTGAGADIPF